MAKSQINTKSKNYLKDRDVFLKELKQFNESKNIPIRPPVVNGIEIDLYHFYTLVQQRGGIWKVNLNDTWETFLKPLKLPHPCINGSTLLRRIYTTYLEKYERAKGPPGRDDDNDLDEDPRRGRGGGMPRITFGGASGEALRSGNRAAAPYERLALSLLSPMPNEQDFAVNVCTVLAADDSNRLPLGTTPHILDFLLAHAGVYNHSSLRDTIGRSYAEARGCFPDEFWQKRAGGGGARELADETKFMQPGVEQPDLVVQALAAQHSLADCLAGNDDDDRSLSDKLVEEEVLEDWVTEPSEENQLFAPEFPGGASCVFTQRVIQIASIVRSLSFHEENVQYLAKNTTLIRFLLLCANCWVGSLRQSGLDTLGNVAAELIIKEPATCLISRHVLSTVQAALVCADRARVLAALELLNKLAQNEANEDALLKALEAKVYADVCALLTMRDIMVVVCTLECVYALTSLGDRASEAVARVPGLVNTLVALVTVEAQSYGPRACILMRVVETVSGPQPEREQEQKPTHPHLQSQTPVKQPPEQVQTMTSVPPVTTTSATVTTPAPVTTLQQSHMQQRTVQENEHFAQAWLRSSYEPLPPADNSACDAAELYRQYLACCSKLQRKGVIAPAHFPRLVRTVFGGTVGPNTITTPAGESQQVYIGIRSRNIQNRTPPPAGPSSPILKAQLTNKPSVEVKPPVSQAQSVHQASSAPAHPQLSQALEAGSGGGAGVGGVPGVSGAAGGNNTSLIKHLLAHKVSPAPHAQVAQRQQNQHRGPAPPSTVVVPSNQQQAMDVDPETLIKCTTITPGGVASSTPAVPEKATNPTEEVIVPKEDPVQIQMDEQAQLTIKTAQNKMLADLLEKKSNPPVQVVQMAQQINAPTIQITETGQIVQVKTDATPIIQISDSGLVTQGNQYFQIKNEQGQLIQIKNEQGQIIQLKSDQLPPQLIQFKNEQGQLVQMKNEGPLLPALVPTKNEKDQMVDTVVTDHSYTEPPAKKVKVEDKRELFQCLSPQEAVSKTAANLYAALAASAVQDEEDLMPPKQDSVEAIQPSVLMAGPGDNASVILPESILQVQQAGIQVQQPTLQVQQPTLQVQQPTLQVQASAIQVQQPLQVQQPMLQVQPMDVQNIIASQSGQLILQEKTIATQPTQYVQQPMQIIATPSTSQGLSYIAQNLPGNMMQKTIIIVQGPTGGGPLTLTVNNPGGLDEATLNSLIAQATEAITQQQIIQNTGVIQSAQRVIVSQPALVSTSQPIAVVKTAIAQNTPQITPSQQPIITTQPQPHKAQLVNQPQAQQIVVQKQPPTLISTSSSNQLMQSTPQLIQSTPQLIQGNQQILQSNQQLLQTTPPLLQSNQPLLQGNQQLLQANQQLIQGSQQLIQGSQQIIAVSNNQQIIMNAPLKQNVHRVVQPPRSQTPVAASTVSQASVAQSEPKNTVIQSIAKTQPVLRQVITRQPVMVGNTKIGDKELVVTQPTAGPEKPPTPKPPKPTVTPPPQMSQTPTPTPAQAPAHDDTPWICHWRGCGKSFNNASEVWSHCARRHAPGGAGGEAPCLWLDCDRVPRRTFALLNHLSDKHCTPQALKAIHNSRRRAAPDTEGNKPVSLGYPPNAALAALNKHAADMFNPRELMHRAEKSRTPEQLDENEGPVTKSIRLTAALILRNMVIYSNTGRRQLRSHEAHLSTIALSSVEASRTIAQVLYDMDHI
ncbi:AT-rich interactive domain-containing protein 2 isoform X4 [Manduca sexta]|uniref:AT-rich interactive domain-containing protein 2 isoform X4 n=1 Tax=Manduca sexta TaxID=7130 RepID=UPI00188ED435|nr:AT-rich interactive domain-containing protein 2 isoform X4 [Manduca sexta]